MISIREINGDLENIIVDTDGIGDVGAVTLAHEQVVETTESIDPAELDHVMCNKMEGEFLQVLVEEEALDVPAVDQYVTISGGGSVDALEPTKEPALGDLSLSNINAFIEVEEDLVPYEVRSNTYGMLSEDEDDNSSGGKRIFIQDADGQIFYVQCPEGFSVQSKEKPEELPSSMVSRSPNQNSNSLGSVGGSSTSSNSSSLSSSQKLSAWLSNVVANDRKPELINPPLRSQDLNNQVMSVLPDLSLEPTIHLHPHSRTSVRPKNPEKIGRRVKNLTKKIRKEIEQAEMGLGSAPKCEEPEIEYETGYDPATGEVKGPNIDLSELPTAPLVEREVNSADDVCKLWTLTPRDKMILRSKGIQWREGPWGEDEVEVLDENIKNYCLQRGHDDPSKVIFSMSKEDRKNFYPIISRGIRRPVFAVYRRVQRDYDPNNHKGVYSPSELERLSALINEYGNDYKRIAETLGRSIESVRDRCRNMHDGRTKSGRGHLAPKDRLVGYNRGKWNSTEEKKLIVAVHEVGRGRKELEEISWTQVAALVKTRTSMQCRKKWAETLKRSQASRCEAAEEKTTDLALLRNLNRVLTPDPVQLTSVTPFTFASLPVLHEQVHAQQLQPLQPQEEHLQHHSTQNVDLVVAHFPKPQEELILFEGVDDETFANLQLSYVTQ